MRKNWKLACLILALCLLAGWLGFHKLPLKRDIEAVKRDAEKGDADAQLLMGMAYSNGICVPKDEEKAMSLVLKSAQQGNLQAEVWLGNGYLNWRRLPKRDLEEGMKWLRDAADRGDDNGEYSLGDLYAEDHRCLQQGEGNCDNLGTKQEVFKTAVFWLEKAANHGHFGATLDLQELYVGVDSEKLCFWSMAGIKLKEIYAWPTRGTLSAEELLMDATDDWDDNGPPCLTPTAAIRQRVDEWKPSMPRRYSLGTDILSCPGFNQYTGQMR